MKINADLYQHPRIITVFGGSGFIGRHVVALLTKAGYRVRVAVRHPDKAYYMKQIGDFSQVEMLPTDVCHEKSVARALEKASAAIFLAGSLSQNDKKNFKNIQEKGTKIVAKLAQAASIPLVYFSSLAADSKSKMLYKKLKAEGESHIRSHCPSAIIVRPSIVFGPEDRFFNKFAGLSQSLCGLKAFGKPSIKLAPIYVMDVAHFVLAAIENKIEPSQVYHLVGKEKITLQKMLETILNIVDRQEKIFYMPRFFASLAGCVSKIPLLPNLITQEHIAFLYEKTPKNAEAEDGLASIPLEPKTIESIVPSYLWRYRPKGQFTSDKAPDWAR